MANPETTKVPGSGTPSKYLNKDFLQKFHKLHDAIRHDNLKELPSDVKEPVNLSGDPLLSALIAYGKSKLAINLLKNMSADELIIAVNFDGDTALHVAVEKGDESVVEALVKKNRDLLEKRNKQREIPLHKAALFGQRRIFWKLVNDGSDVKAKREDGASMLHCAIMGNAPELALEIASTYEQLMFGRNEKAVTPLQLMVTISKAFPSQSHLGPFESLIYKCIPLEEREDKHVEESSVQETSDARYKDDECLQYVTTSRRKFPRNYATFFDMLELACIPVRWARILVFNILKQLSTRIQELECLKKDHKKAMELIAYLAKDPLYWDFIDKGKEPEPSEIAKTPSGISEIPATEPDIEKQGKETTGKKDHTEDSKKNRWNESRLILAAEMGLREFAKQLLTSEDSKKNESPLIFAAEMGLREFAKQFLNSEKNRWNESPLILGAEMGLHEFVETILTVCPASAVCHGIQERNVLQVAIQKGQEKIVDIIESMLSENIPVLPSWLLSEIEEKTKNTILHLASVVTGQENSPAIQMLYELQWFEVESLVRKDLKYSRNEEEKTAQELFNEKHKDMVKEGKEQLMEMGKTYSGLIAAVVFASSFSIPGEKDANNNPVFLHKIAFKVFSHAYVIGLSCAATALVLFLSLLTSAYRAQEFRRSLPTKYFFAILSFSLSLVALLVAFTCNIYLNIYGGRKAETKDIVPLVCELTIFPMVCAFVLLYRGAFFGFGSFMRRVWR